MGVVMRTILAVVIVWGEPISWLDSASLVVCSVFSRRDYVEARRSMTVVQILLMWLGPAP